MEDWYSVYIQYQKQLEIASSDDEREEIIQSYRMWKWSYPQPIAEKTYRDIAKTRIQEQIDKLQQLKKELDSMDDNSHLTS